MHKGTGATDFRSEVKEKIIKELVFKCSPQEGGSAGRLGRWSHCGSHLSVPSHHPGSLGTVSSQAHRWRQQQVGQVTTCYFARLPGAQLHSRLCRISRQGWRHFCSVWALGKVLPSTGSEDISKLCKLRAGFLHVQVNFLCNLSLCWLLAHPQVSKPIKVF